MSVPWSALACDLSHTDRIARVETLLLSSFAFLFLPWLCKPLQRRAGRRAEVSGFLEFLWWINRAYCAGMHRLVNLNEAPLPEHGPAILVANHTSGVDNLVLQAGCRRVLGFMVAQEFYNSAAVGPSVPWERTAFCPSSPKARSFPNRDASSVPASQARRS
jgi:hypothetical protein